MDLAELQVFLTVASERSFSRAAARLHRTQPAISQAVKRRGKWISKRPSEIPRQMAVAACCGVWMAGMGKSFLSVRSVFTKPGLTRYTFNPLGRKSL